MGVRLGVGNETVGFGNETVGFTAGVLLSDCSALFCAGPLSQAG